MTRLLAAQEMATAGERDAAAAAFAEVWAEVGEDGDPLHVVTLAHYMADVQDDPRAELEWDLRALRAAERLTDGRAQEHHAALSVRGFLPSLHLNLAADHTKLGDRDAALRHLAAAEAAVPALADDGYGRMIRGGIDRLRAELAG
ncbi:hypothetical protein BJF78_24250 [Pseudonocardia sp. CNS-139]|nr:hypothetical protein BJF78_24250 [Pseudonocardia sp. CNS-139]